MGKPGEMVQILREAYEEQLEAYRLLRNKFLIAVPGMDLDKEKQLYDQWKLDLHLNSIISFDRALPPEQRTCETCARGCLPNERVYVNPDAEDPCPGWTPHAPQSADVETVRKALDSVRGWIPEQTEDDCMGKVDCALAALDRIAGVLR